MRPKLKRLPEQTIVITGASSGIGLTTARRAARAGANVILVSRNEEALQQICDEIRQEGGDADFVVAGRNPDRRMLLVYNRDPALSGHPQHTAAIG